MVFVSDDGMPPSTRDIVQYSRTGALKRVSEMSCHLDPLSYPLLYWSPNAFGFGWHPKMTHRADRQTASRTRLTAEQYYSYYLMRRDDNPLPHGAGRLFQQWVVDAYCKVEGQRLFFARNNQELLRAADYDAVQGWVKEQTKAATPLPASSSKATAPAAHTV